MYQFDIMETLMVNMRATSDDKPLLHAQAKNLLKYVQKLIHDTQPGPGEFKWSAKARKDLTKPAYGKYQNPTLIVARENGEVWHTDGHYMVKGEPSKRFEPCDYQDLPMHSVKQIIMIGGVSEVKIVGGKEVTGVDCVAFDNGTTVKRVYLSYVTATIGNAGGEFTYLNAGELYPVYVLSGGAVMGMIMPYRNFGK